MVMLRDEYIMDYTEKSQLSRVRESQFSLADDQRDVISPYHIHVTFSTDQQTTEKNMLHFTLFPSPLFKKQIN